MEIIKNFIKRYIVTILIIISVILIYDYLTKNGLINEFVFVTIDEIISSFHEFGSDMFKNMFASFSILFPSLFVGTVIAVTIGTILGAHRKIEIALSPIVSACSVVPSILLSPIAIQVAPSFRSAAVGMLIYNIIWPILIATISGIQTINSSYIDIADTLELKKTEKLFRVMFPAAMSTILSGFTTSLINSFIILTFVEMYGSDAGIGYFIKYYSLLGVYKHVWSGFIFLMIVLVLVKEIYERIKRRILYWTL